MQPWIKNTIKNTPIAYLSIIHDQSTWTIVFPYSYDKGHLKGSISILHADFISQIKKYPYASLVIEQPPFRIIMTGKIVIHDEISRMQSDWKGLGYYNLVQTHPDILNVPHLNKRVILNFIPSTLAAQSNEETVKYEMEIL